MAGGRWCCAAFAAKIKEALLGRAVRWDVSVSMCLVPSVSPGGLLETHAFPSPIARARGAIGMRSPAPHCLRPCPASYLRAALQKARGKPQTRKHTVRDAVTAADRRLPGRSIPSC